MINLHVRPYKAIKCLIQNVQMISVLLNKCLTLRNRRRGRSGKGSCSKINDTITGHEAHKFSAKSGYSEPVQVDIPEVYHDAHADCDAAEHGEQHGDFAVPVG